MKNKKVEKSLDFMMFLFGLLFLNKEFRNELRQIINKKLETEDRYEYGMTITYLYQIIYGLLFSVTMLYFYLPYLFIGLLVKSDFGFNFFFFIITIPLTLMVFLYGIKHYYIAFKRKMNRPTKVDFMAGIHRLDTFILVTSIALVLIVSLLLR